MRQFVSGFFPALFLLVAAGCTSLPAQNVEPGIRVDVMRERVGVPDRIVQRSFPFLHVLNTHPDIQTALVSNALFATLAEARSERIEQAIATCEDSVVCIARPWLWSDAETGLVGDVFVKIAPGAGLAARLRETRAYPLYADLSDEALVRRAWMDTAAALNGTARTYGFGEAPFYPNIDSARFAPGDPVYAKLLRDASDLALGPADRRKDPLSAAGQFSLFLLYLNERENAGFYPQLDDQQNGPARDFASRVNWADYPYSAILVLGDGPDEVGTELGSFGKLRLFHAAELYRSGLAPILIVSGGNVHPAGTHINEAETMKSVLIERYGIPERAIIMEPHARHTTTNFRNSARLMIRYGFPIDQPALVSTSRGQSAYAEGAEFRDRSLAELGYLPMTLGARLSPFDQEFWVSLLSDQINPADPLDP